MRKGCISYCHTRLYHGRCLLPVQVILFILRPEVELAEGKVAVKYIGNRLRVLEGKLGETLLYFHPSCWRLHIITKGVPLYRSRRRGKIKQRVALTERIEQVAE